MQAVESKETAPLDRLKTNARDDVAFANKLNICRDNYKQLGPKSLIGWDYCRYIDLCRWGYLCGYIDEQEAWAKIMPAAVLLQKTFGSWADLGKNYLIGRAFWSSYISGRDSQAMQEIYSGLLKSDTSPWKLYPWNTRL